MLNKTASDAAAIFFPENLPGWVPVLLVLLLAVLGVLHYLRD